MNAALKTHVARLNADYTDVSGAPFHHFFCPILYQDEDTELCRAHVINKSFRDSDRSWTVQRADVDTFYGSRFEAEFIAIQEKDRHRADEVLADTVLARQLRPRLILGGADVEYYHPRGDIPPEHSMVEVATQAHEVQLAVKRPPETIQDGLTGLVQIEKSIPLEALVSLLKAAHLTLFHLLGYRYALSDGGYFLGKTVLGDFFLQNRKRERDDILKSAWTHFKQFANMVRPVLSRPFFPQGTLTDHLLYFCVTGNRPWAFLIFVKTESHLSAVMVPVMDGAETTLRFTEFLERPCSALDIRLARWKGEAWEVSPKSETAIWPAAPFDFPDRQET